MIASTCQAPGSTGPHRAVVSLCVCGSEGGGSGAPIMGLHRHRTSLGVSVERTQKLADEEWVGGVVGSF